MAILRIAHMGHPVLRYPAAPIKDPADPAVRRLAEDMQETLEHIAGNGVAAPQVYVPIRLVVYRITPAKIPAGSGWQTVPWTVMVNPVITPVNDEKFLTWERCLSLPGLHGKVPRFAHICIRFQDLAGNAVEREATGSHAAVLQHEVDHLDGLLYPMRMNDMTTFGFNVEPGALAADGDNETLEPLFQKMVDDWPDRDKWQAWARSKEGPGVD
ncbi:MAG: peptide deformylase [Alphaproteobacteria bacterium]|nr:peptide deformylase [Alphaproteobacteria bacterium]